MRKKLFLLTLLLTGFLSAANAYPGDNEILQVWYIDDTYDEYDMENNPEITYTGSQLIVKSDLVETCYERSQIRKLSFVAKEIQKIEDTQTQNFKFRLKANVVTMEGLDANERVRVFGIDGQLLETATASANGMVSISLEARSAGVYIIKADKHQTIKVTRR